MVDQEMKATLTECPDPEVLAAYLAGRLPETDRTAVTEHLADCADCYAVFIASAREYRGWRWAWAEWIWHAVVEASGWSKAVVVTAALGTATASLTVFLRPQLVTQLWPGRSELTELVAAVGTERTIEPRLTGGFAYGPLVERSVTRSGERGGDRLSPDLRIAALTLEKRLQGHREPSTLAAYAAGQLVTGQTDRAVSAFEEAARRVPKNARFQNDLSAAYLVRFKQKQDLEDVSKAVAAATAATEIDPSFTEARFNLAIALESLSLRNEARKAWEAYLKIDSKSPWAQEAKRHLDALAPEKQSQRFEGEHRQVAEAAARGDREAVLRVVKRLPDTAYDCVENELIPEWADAWTTGDPERASDVLRRARLLGDALAATVGERMAMDAVAAIDHAVSSGAERTALIARGHRLFRDGRAWFAKRISNKGVELFRESQQPLLETKSPFTEWVTLYLSNGSYLQGDLISSGRPLDALLTNARAQAHLTLEGRALRARGLLRGAHGMLADSLTDYREALSTFQKIDAREDLAGIHTVVAERLWTIGDTKASWGHFREALASLPIASPLGTRRTALLIGADIARREEMLAVALALTSELLDEAEPTRPAIDIAQAYLLRSDIHHLMENNDAATADAASATQWAGRLSDPGVAQRLQVEAELRISELPRKSLAGQQSPDGVNDSLRRSLAYFQHAGMSQRLPQVYLALGRAQLAEGRRDDGAASFIEGITILERQRALLPTGELRLGYFDQPWNLYDELIELLASEPGKRRDSLGYAERFRARDLLETASGTVSTVVQNPADLVDSLTDCCVVAYYVSLHDKLLIWIIKRGKVEFVERTLSFEELATEAHSLQVAMANRAEADFYWLSEHLYVWLVEPVVALSSPNDTIVLVPDGALHTIPFAALRNPQSKRYLIEEHALAIAPSATVLSRASDRMSQMSARRDRVLVVANPKVDPSDASDLRSLTGAEMEARNIADLYPDTVVLAGANASKAEFIKAAGSADIVHFAGHAVANEVYPILSRLLFARDHEGHTGVMLAHELLSIPFTRTSLVVLAACSTAAGPLRKGEGAISLARPFLARGVPSVIATLWDVDDRASETLLSAFYTRLRSGSPPAEALRSAQLELLKNSENDLNVPSAWAGFVNMGGITLHRSVVTSPRQQGGDR